LTLAGLVSGGAAFFTSVCGGTGVAVWSPAVVVLSKEGAGGGIAGARVKAASAGGGSAAFSSPGLSFVQPAKATATARADTAKEKNLRMDNQDLLTDISTRRAKLPYNISF
jgi:hypothetical protein